MSQIKKKRKEKEKQMIWKCFVLVYYSILKSMLNKNLSLFTLSKVLHRHFEELEEDVFSWEKPYTYSNNRKYFALVLKPWKRTKNSA